MLIQLPRSSECEGVLLSPSHPISILIRSFLNRVLELIQCELKSNHKLISIQCKETYKMSVVLQTISVKNDEDDIFSNFKWKTGRS